METQPLGGYVNSNWPYNNPSIWDHGATELLKHTSHAMSNRVAVQWAADEAEEKKM